MRRARAGSHPHASARATTPLLDEELKGNVYLRSSSNPLCRPGPRLPRRPVDFNAVGEWVWKPARMAAALDVEMQGGRRGLILEGPQHCAKKPRASTEVAAHSGRWAFDRWSGCNEESAATNSHSSR